MKPNNERCKAPAGADGFCFHHSPAAADRRREARQAGGRARATTRATLPTDTPDVPLTTVAEVCVLLAETINSVRRGQIDPKIGSCIGFLAGQLIGALRSGPLEERLAAVEERLATQQRA